MHQNNLSIRLVPICLALLLTTHFTPSASLAGAVACLAGEVARAAEICTGMIQQAGEELIRQILFQQD